MRIFHSILFFFSVVLMLGTMCLVWPRNGLCIMGHTYRFPSIAKVLNLKEENPSETESEPQTDDVDVIERIEEMTTEMQLKQNGPMDEFEQKFLDFANNNAARIYLPANNIHYLDNFFAQADSARIKGENIHVAHYGDSQIEADRITSFIRKSLQKEFGGAGPGLLPAVQAIGSYTVSQSSQNLERYLIDGTLATMARDGNKRYGALAQFATLNGNASMSFRIKKDKIKEFQKVRLFVGKTDKGFTASLTRPGKKAITQKIENSTAGASTLTWNLPATSKSFTLQLSGKGEVYGVSLDSHSGVAVSNIPMRGSRGTFFTKMDPTLFSYMHHELNTKLILMEFGGNIMPIIKDTTDIDYYHRLFAMQIQWVKKACPGAAIIVIGPSDMGTSVNGEIKTRPFLPENVNSMKACALENGVAFWDMYDVMGGYNSMKKWVKQRPPLALTDYTHFTNTGAERIGKLFSESLENYHEYYQKTVKSQRTPAISPGQQTTLNTSIPNTTSQPN